MTPTSSTTLSRAAAVLVSLALASGVSAQTQRNQPDGGGDDSRSSVRAALESSLRMTSIQHMLRVGFEEKTRSELGGSFLGDYRRSLRLPDQWSDGDGWVTNYVGHPVQGAASGFIWLGSRPADPFVFSPDRRYVGSRLRATAWAAGYSLQFELGLLSEASIGNVGLRPETTGWTDHVITPAGGLAFMVGEDILDRFVIEKLERRTRSVLLRATLRLLLNPSRSAANTAAMQAPWHRANRPLRRQAP